MAISASCLALAFACEFGRPDAASVITCPAEPSGWYIPPGSDGRYVLTLLSGGDVNEGPIADGGSQVNVDGTYWTHQGGRLTVSVRYALRSDLNPFADFCSREPAPPMGRSRTRSRRGAQ